MTTETTVNLEVVSPTRQRVGELAVPAALVSGPVRTHLLYEAVKSQLAARRAGTHATKTRGFVSGGGKKPWKQKGTGNARAGSNRSPIWRGGAIIFGPQPRSYEFTMPKSARRAALCSAVASRHAGGALLVVDGISLPEPKTKQLVGWLAGLGVTGSVLLVVGDGDGSVQRAGRNLPKVKVTVAGGINVRDILGHQQLVITREAMTGLAARLQGNGEAGE